MAAINSDSVECDRNVLERVPELIFETDARLMPSYYDRSFYDSHLALYSSRLARAAQPAVRSSVETD